MEHKKIKSNAMSCQSDLITSKQKKQHTQPRRNILTQISAFEKTMNSPQNAIQSFLFYRYTCLWTYSISLNLRQQQHDAIKSKNNTARTTKARTSVHRHGTRQMCTVYRVGGVGVEGVGILERFLYTEYWLFDLTLKGSERPASGMVGSVFLF